MSVVALSVLRLQWPVPIMDSLSWLQQEHEHLHGVRVVGPSAAELPGRPRPSTSITYQPVRKHIGCDMSIPRQPLDQPTCLEIPDTPLHRIGQEGRQNYRPAAPIQRFNNKSLNWPSWFRHFRAVADVHGWDKSQRTLQLLSYLDDFMAGRGVIMRMQGPSPMPSHNYSVSAIHRAHRSSARS